MIWLSCKSVLMKHEAVESPAMTLTVRAIDPVRLEPRAIFAKILANRPDQEGSLPQESQIVGDVGSGSTSAPGERIDQERHAQDVHLVRQDVIAKPAGENHDVVIGDRTGDENPHSMYLYCTDAGIYFEASPSMSSVCRIRAWQVSRPRMKRQS